jgi:hypothetical protein
LIHPIASAENVNSVTGSDTVVDQLDQAQADPDTIEQVTSVSQLNDVQPNDWAFQALQSLVERYGCIAGYPNSTFRGNRALSRYEFAAGLNACLDRINELIATATSEAVSKEDLSKLQKLREDFSAELATLRGRVDALEARRSELEANQFSTTTKLSGQVIFGIQGRASSTSNIPRTPGANVVDPATNITFAQQTQVNLVTQFKDRSILLTGLQAGNINTGADPTSNFAFNNNFTRLSYESNTNNSLILSDLNYRLLLGDKAAVIVGPKGVNAINVFRGPNRVESAGQGPLSLFAQRNPVISMNGGDAGIGFDWQIASPVSLQAVYSASNAANPGATSGLFDGPRSLGVQLAFNPIKTVDLSLYYLNFYTTNGTLNNSVGDNLIGVSFPDTSASRFSTDAFGGTLAWQVNPKLTVGGWGGFTTSHILNTGFSGSVDTTNWMGFINLVDVFQRGDLAGIYIGQPPKITSSNLSGGINFPSLLSNTGGVAGGQPGTTTHLEAFYRFRLSDNISITPGMVMIFNPSHTSTSDTITIGTLRTTFSF